MTRARQIIEVCAGYLIGSGWALAAQGAFA
jgi:hypothetical protein